MMVAVKSRWINGKLVTIWSKPDLSQPGRSAGARTPLSRRR